MRHSNRILTEAAYQDSRSNDVDDLEETLKDLKDSERKLQEILNSASNPIEVEDNSNSADSEIQNVDNETTPDDYSNGNRLDRSFEISEIIVNDNSLPKNMTSSNNCYGQVNLCD